MYPDIKESAGKSVSRVLLCLLLITTAALTQGCAHIKRIFEKPPLEGVISNSYPVRVMGYKQTIAIRSTPEELSEYLDRMENKSTISFSQIQPAGEDVSGDEPRQTVKGSTFPLNVKVVGVNIPGTLIAVKVEEHKDLWILWDNPYIFQIQRWESKPVKEGTRLTLQFDTEIPSEGILGNIADTMGIMGVADMALRDVDMMMAMIQANFDPSINPREIVSHGLRGEAYDGMFQAYEAKTWIDAPVEKVEKWMTDPDNAAVYLKELQVAHKDIERFKQAPLDQVVFSEASLDIGAIKTRVDLFGVKRKKGREFIMRLYYVFPGNLGYMELSALPEAGGTTAKTKFIFDVPSFSSAQGMEMILFITGIPKILQERLLMIKNGVEEPA